DLPRERMLASAAANNENAKGHCSGDDREAGLDRGWPETGAAWLRMPGRVVGVVRLGFIVVGPSSLRVGRVDDFEMGAGDAGPGAAGVELEVALPVLDRLAVTAVARQSAREIEVGVGVVGRELERLLVVADGFLDRAAVLVQGPEVVGGLAALRILVER